MPNTLYYGDNLDLLRKYVDTETVDLCYIDPPFNSKRNYNQIYNNVGTEDRAQAQAFTDTWVWDERASEGFSEILANDKARFSSQTIELIKGLCGVLGQGSLLAYLVSMTRRITEIRRVLKSTGSFYLHCDPTASHYLKLILDAVFCAQGGDFRNEIVWCYKSGGASKKDFAKKHDVIFRYTKGPSFTFNYSTEKSYGQTGGGQGGKVQYYKDEIGSYSIVGVKDWWTISMLSTTHSERLGYPTQKPEALLDRIIAASTNEGDTVLDAYCGCGTTIAVAQRLGRRWIGMDITYQSISLILRRLEGQFGKSILAKVILNGIPKDMASARALANKKDDRVRKEFEKWALLTYTNNRAIVNEKKGGDGGIDGTAYFLTGASENSKAVFQVKSGNVGRGDISKLNNDRTREGADLAVFLTLQGATQGMKDEANSAGLYDHKLMGRNYPRVQIVTIGEVLERNMRMDIPMSLEVLKAAKLKAIGGQMELPEQLAV